MVLNYFQWAPSQYTTHVYHVLQILEDINNHTTYGPLSIEDILTLLYVKSIRVTYMWFKRNHKRHIYLFPNKRRFEKTPAYEVRAKYTASVQALEHTRPYFDGNFNSILLILKIVQVTSLFSLSTIIFLGLMPLLRLQDTLVLINFLSCQF